MFNAPRWMTTHAALAGAAFEASGTSMETAPAAATSERPSFFLMNGPPPEITIMPDGRRGNWPACFVVRFLTPICAALHTRAPRGLGWGIHAADSRRLACSRCDLVGIGRAVVGRRR